jgi:integrase
MKKMKLDARTIRAVSQANHSAWNSPNGPRTELFCWDSELEGFGLRLRRHTDGTLLRSWVIQYRIHGRSQRITLGKFERLGASEARKAARRKWAIIALDRDPQAELRDKRRETRQSFRSVVSEYLADREDKLRPASFRMTKLYLTGPYFRPLHGMALAHVTRADVSGCVKAVERKHSSTTASRARAHLSAFFVWAIEGGLLGSGGNPVDGSPRPAEPKPRERVLTDAELVAIWNACNGDDYGRILRLLILLGSRRREVGGMPWTELDPVGVWTLPAERSKNKREHKIVLPPAALDIIASVPRRAGCDQLFGPTATGFTRWYAGKQALDQRLKATGVKPWRLHDLRRTVATRMADIGVQPHIIEAALNHFSGHRAGVAGVYNRSTYASEAKSALARWSNHVLALVEGRDDSNIVPLHA